MRKSLLIIFLAPMLLYGQRVFLIGDAGELKNPNKTLQLLVEKFAEATEQDVLIFLGDNLYPKGLPNKEDTLRTEMENKLIPQLEVMKQFPGRAFIVPGNHDWARGRKYGWQQAQNMEQFVTEYFQDDQVFLPAGSCPGPVEVELNSQAMLIILNTQYFLHTWNKPGDDSFCESKSTIDALIELRNMIKRNAGKHVIIAAHHPVYTYGEHHGKFSFKEHIFPLTAFKEKLYLPLPVLGSIQPVFRGTIGNIQDNTNLRYKAVMRQVKLAMDEANHVIYVAGHEHSLQYIEQEEHHYIVSGSGAKTTHVGNGKGSLFAKNEQGFAEVNLSTNGAAAVKYWGVEGGLLFEKELYNKELKSQTESLNSVEYSDSTVTAQASDLYVANKGKQKWLGRNYREVWSAPIDVKLFDLSRAKGGLKILKQGGGMATKSLRMEADDGRQYVLRSIEKYPDSVVPKALRKTFAMDLVRDQTSAAHPYGAFIIPELADAAQIYHTNPELVFIPDDPNFGNFREQFAGTLSLFEERPNEESAEDMFGAKDVISTSDVLEELRDDNDNSVDQNFVVRNRLFDLWIGDWDRHDDQWRWAKFDKENAKGNIYKPIPRDRDQTFFINDGFVPKIASKKWAIPKLEGFDEEVRWAPGLSFNARFFDRTFINGPSWEDWQEQIDFLQNQLTDDVIDRAIAQWPAVVQQSTGEAVRSGLRARRQDMGRYARELYEFLSREVEIVGSDRHEHFLINRLSELEVEVTVFKRSKEEGKKQVIYSRLFSYDETKEIRLYGLAGNDVFKITGDVDSRIKVRIIGGSDKDKIVNDRGEAKIKNVFVYDKPKGIKVEGNETGILKLSKNAEINNYTRRSYKYDVLMPLVSGAFNKDDGVFIGGGFSLVKNKWRKEPFASKHTLWANTAFETGSFNFSYDGVFSSALGKWDVNPNITWQHPFFVNNFFGLGNESRFLKNQSPPSTDDPVEFYRTRINRFEADLNLVKRVGGQGKFYFGSGYRAIQVEENADRFLTDTIVPGAFLRHDYTKLKAGISMDSRDSPVLPKHGMTGLAEVERMFALSSFSQSFSRMKAEWAFYLSLDHQSKLVVANRLGTAHNTMGHEFFNANTLGGRSNLRGYRRTRFYGHTSFYHNLDLRVKLFSFRSYIFPGRVGLLAFHDTGRVWLDGERSSKWHTGKGGGIWVSPLDLVVLNLNYAIGEEEKLVSFAMNFFF
ncbi:MAG: BamA/TamA family outer membrane protein [Cytophagales bacterium]|nr:BamA/TamA family outer membrane protein [Cytophagales bacterium]